MHILNHLIVLGKCLKHCGTGGDTLLPVVIKFDQLFFTRLLRLRLEFVILPIEQRTSHVTELLLESEVRISVSQ